MDEYKKRIVDDILQKQLKSIGAVLIEGPKWCGKTTTGEQFAKSILYMDDPHLKNKNKFFLETDPQKLLLGETPLLIDEWQIFPQLWDCVRFEVDHRKKMGQFILTGSSVPADYRDISHSGTGRFAYLTMRTMSLYESGDSSGEVSLKNLFDGKKLEYVEAHLSSDDLAYLICRGGWPQALEIEKGLSLLTSRNYFDSVVRNDINRVDNVIKDQARVIKFMRSYARNQGGQVSNKTFALDIFNHDDFSINQDTIASYITCLKKIFVIEDLPAWNPNLRSKTPIRTSDTRYFSDPSLATSALRIGPNDLINDFNTFGLLFETLAIRDLRVYTDANDGNVYHYRDKDGLECDAVIHLRNGKYGLIEIKLGGDSLIEDGAKSLIALKNKIDTTKMDKPSFLMVLVGIGDLAYTRSDGVLVVPISILKN